MNAANLMKPALAHGELRLLGATTTAEYRRYIEKDGVLERRFQPLKVREPSVENTLDILRTVVPWYSGFHERTTIFNIVKADGLSTLFELVATSLRQSNKPSLTEDCTTDTPSGPWSPSNNT